MRKEILFVTQNKNKLKDAQALMPSWNLKHIDCEVPEIQSLSSKEIVTHKIQYAFEETNTSCFVMDASLSLTALNNFPGPLIKWFYKSIGPEKICSIANHLNEHKCKWSTILGFYDGSKFVYFEESVDGKIAQKPKGSNGYDWDVIFVPENDNRTFAEMSFEEKQKYALTKPLLKKFDNYLKENYG